MKESITKILVLTVLICISVLLFASCDQISGGIIDLGQDPAESSVSGTGSFIGIDRDELGDETYTYIFLPGEELPTEEYMPGGTSPDVGDSTEERDELGDETHTYISLPGEELPTEEYMPGGTSPDVGDSTEDGTDHAHIEVEDAGRAPTFGNDGMTDGSHCSVCGEVLKEQVTIPALGGDVLASTDYFDGDESVSYRYSYSLTRTEGDRFFMSVLKIGSDDSYSLDQYTGVLELIKDDLYHLSFDQPHDSMYIRLNGNEYEFCNSEGGSLFDKDFERPEGNTEVDITPRMGNNSYGYYDLSRNTHGKSMQELYRKLYSACETFIKSGADVTEKDGLFLIEAVELAELEITASEAVSVWKVFYCENPRYYWLSNTVSLVGSEMMLCVDEDYAKATSRAEHDSAIDEMALSLKSRLTDGMSQLDIALEIHDFILDRMNYAYEEDGKTPQDDIWAHNMTGCASYGLGVCESYAKTYQYLSLLNGLECLVVSGTAGEDHAWNVVKIDGVWYGVDCTWDETNTEEISYNCFGMSQSYLDESHKADSPDVYGSGYLYELPAVSEENVQLVYLYKENEHIGAYRNIDSAFEAMTDTNGNYEIKLHVYSMKGILLLGSPAIEHRIYSSQTPHVNSLKISGSMISLGGDYFKSSHIFIKSDLSINSDMIFDDVALYGFYAEPTVNINSNECRFEGNQYYVSVSKIIGAEGSKIVAACTGDVDFSGIIDVDMIELYGNGCMTYRGAEMHVNSIWSERPTFCLYGDGVKNVEIGELYSDISFDCCEAPDIKITNIGKTNSGREYSHISVSGFAGEKLPKISITGEVKDTKIYYSYYGSMVHLTTDMGGNEIDKYSETDTLDKNTVLISGKNLKYEDFYLISEQIDTFDLEVNTVIECKMYDAHDASEVLDKNENGDFVFIGWSDAEYGE